jgi:hypothetical protein
MGLYYETEYCLGRRRGNVCRRYTGFRAYLAIAIDLFFVLTFDLVFGLLFFVLRNTLKLLTLVFYLLSLPFHLIRWMTHRLERRILASNGGSQTSATVKPAWPAYDEV